MFLYVRAWYAKCMCGRIYCANIGFASVCLFLLRTMWHLYTLSGVLKVCTGLILCNVAIKFLWYGIKMLFDGTSRWLIDMGVCVLFFLVLILFWWYLLSCLWIVWVEALFLNVKFIFNGYAVDEQCNLCWIFFIFRTTSGCNGIFSRRLDFSTFNVLPRTRLNSYQIKVRLSDDFVTVLTPML